MDKIELFVMFYIIITFNEMINISKKYSKYYYIAIMTILCIMNVLSLGYIYGFIPTLYLDIDTAETNLFINILFILLIVSGYYYSKYKISTNIDKRITPESLRSMLSLYKVNRLKRWLYYSIIASVIYFKLIPTYNFHEYKLMAITIVAIIFVFIALYKFKSFIIDNDPVFEDVPDNILNEWLSRSYYNDEEQVLLKKRLVKLKIYNLVS